VNVTQSHVRQMKITMYVEDRAKETVAAMERACVLMGGQEQPVIVRHFRVNVETLQMYVQVLLYLCMCVAQFL